MEPDNHMDPAAHQHNAVVGPPERARRRPSAAHGTGHEEGVVP